MKDGKPYELFTGLLENGLSKLPPTIKECEVVKNIIESIDADGKPTRIKRYDNDQELHHSNPQVQGEGDAFETGAVFIQRSSERDSY